jgi:hypothetical protein
VKTGVANLVGACDEGASSPLMSSVFSRRKVLSLAGVDADADGPGAAMAAPLSAPSGACCSLLPPLVDAECAAPEDARTPTAGGGRRWTAGAPPPSSAGTSTTAETMDCDGDRRESGARNWGGNGGAGEAEQRRRNPKKTKRGQAKMEGAKEIVVRAGTHGDPGFF